ncbi:MAG: alkaline phosphatase family protein, partial [Clostridia bacterium]|nr:alkaline phosphatase family protein [Clostridia bacterium]
MRYKHVFVIGVDGAGSFFRETETPRLDEIFGNGAVSYDVLTSNPTISAQCWGSMLLGVTPEVHGLTNSIVGD